VTRIVNVDEWHRLCDKAWPFGSSSLRQTVPSARSSAKTRKERLAEALRANLLRRKAKAATDASQDSKKSDDQSMDEGTPEESGR
jgi:hypothetical protein